MIPQTLRPDADSRPPLLPETDQRRASDPAASVWVGASAGSGKTKVLADRVMRLLLSGVNPQKILGLTFTRAAAAEMAIRITQQLARWAVGTDDALREDLDALQGTPPEPEQLDIARRLFAQVLACPGGMRIRTIHAFGQEILRRFPLEAGLSPHFTVLDEPDAQALWHDARDAVLRQAAAKQDSPEGRALQTLVRDLGEDSFSSLLREATNDSERLHQAITHAGGLAPFLATMRGALQLDAKDTETTIREAAVTDAAFARPALTQAAAWLAEGTQTDNDKSATIRAWLNTSSAERMESFETYCLAFLTLDNEPRKKPATKKVVTAHPEIESILGREAARLVSVLERLDSARTADQTAALITLATAVGAGFAARKAAQAALDYTDLIRRTDDLLRREGIAPWVLFKLDGGVDHILVDEAQDTSPEQWRIVAALADEFFAGKSARDAHRTLFVVGDEKQSIFSFQGADPDKFHAMGAVFREKIRAAARAYDEVPLTISFRSAPAILKAVDAVFAAENARRGVTDGAVCHSAFRREAAGRVEVWPLIETPEKEQDPTGVWAIPVGYETARDPAAELAEKIATQIQTWLRDGSTIEDRKTKQERPLSAGDVMILVRRRDAFVDHLVRHLKTRNVPVTGVDRMVLTSQLAVMDLLALLQFTLLPEDDLTLATVLRGPLLGCREDALMTLAIDRKGTLWESLNQQTDPSFTVLREYLRRWLEDADSITPFAMLARLLSEPCPADAGSGRRALWARLGPDSQDPLDELLNAAQNFGTRHTPSLQAFLHWLTATETQVKREPDQGVGRVRITTVHASKGLESPIVILPDTTTVPQKTMLPHFLWHPDLNVPFYVPREPRHSLLNALRERASQRQLEEYRRLLYVALTRAADRLYVCGWKGAKATGFEDSWYNLVHTALTPLHDPAVCVNDAVVAFADEPCKPRALPQATTREEGGVPQAHRPFWLSARPPSEPTPARPLAPSRAFEDESALASPQKARFARGKIIHRLLQSLPDVDPARQDEAATRFLANPQHALSPEQQDDLRREVLALLRHPDAAPLFGKGSRAEVPLVGRLGPYLVAGQIDRLCVRDNDVWIVDYKTNRPPPEDAANVPTAYLRQLAAYRAVLREIYPDKPVRCFLLWTYGPRFMPIPEDLLPESRFCS